MICNLQYSILEMGQITPALSEAILGDEPRISGLGCTYCFKQENGCGQAELL